MGRRNQCESHAWYPTRKKEGEEKCEFCGDMFPCKRNECEHLDCDEVRSKGNINKGPKCSKCAKVVKGDRRYFVRCRGGHQPIHAKCINNGDETFEVKIYE